jgi:hypothetical protein
VTSKLLKGQANTLGAAEHWQEQVMEMHVSDDAAGVAGGDEAANGPDQHALAYGFNKGG